MIEIAAVKVESWQLTDEFHSLIDCGRAIPKTVQRIHGISDKMLSGQPDPESVFRKFMAFIGKAPLIAHNASFDRSFVRSEFGQLGWRFNNPMRCTLRLSRRLLPRLPDHRLVTVYRHLFPTETEDLQLHRALDDARMAARIWMTMEGSS